MQANNAVPGKLQEVTLPSADQSLVSKGGFKIGVSRLDGKHERSRASHESINSTNEKALNQAKDHLRLLAEKKKLEEMKKKKQERDKKQKAEQSQAQRNELYLANKFTRQFIMVTSLVLQSEDLDEDSILTYPQFTEFSIRFGMMSERAALVESDERALLYEMWCTLARVHPDAAFIKVVNLKTVITAVLGFPVAV